MAMTKDHLNTLFTAWQDLPPEGIPLPKLSAHATQVFCILSQLIALMARDAPETPAGLTPHHLAAMMPHIPDSALSGDSHFETVKDSLQYLYAMTKGGTQSPLFPHSAAELRESIHNDLRRLWAYLGFSMTFLG